MKEFKKLSKRQQNILKFMHNYLQDNGYPPTIREIGTATDIASTSVVNYNLNKLVSAGYLDRTEKASRGLRIVADIPGVKTKKVRPSPKIVKIPMIGRIVASQPVEVPDDMGHYTDADEMLDLPPSMLNNVDPSEVFALEVRGDSMIDAMISNGDIVIMQKQDTANNGDMVAVWLPEQSETTLKHFYHEGQQVRLQPAHPTMEPIYVDAHNCQIKGKVLSVIRQVH